MLRSSVTVPPVVYWGNVRREQPTSTDAFGNSCCWIDTPYDQSDGRTPHPLTTPGSMFAPTRLLLPNSALLMAPHESIDGSIGVTPTRFCAPGFVRSQSGTKL